MQTNNYLKVTIEKLNKKIIENVIEENIKDKTGKNQAGFTAGRSCAEHIYTIQQKKATTEQISSIYRY